MKPRLPLITPALAAVAVLGAAEAATSDQPARAARTVGVTVGDDFFRPSRLSVNPGDVVRWRFRGRDTHNVTSTAGPTRIRSGNRRSGSFSQRLRRGSYRIVCTLHRGMSQRISVR